MSITSASELAANSFDRFSIRLLTSSGATVLEIAETAINNANIAI
jgi:hypothetical protein